MLEIIFAKYDKCHVFGGMKNEKSAGNHSRA